MDAKELKQYVADNPKLVSMKECGGYPGLYVLKYRKTVFYRDLWNNYLEECRGTIVDADFNVVSRPFTKIYNYGIEAAAPKLEDDTQVDAYRKVNGFMVAVTWHDGDILVSTTGSTDSPYVAMARELIDLDVYRKVCKEWYGTTFMFECVHRDDPHIIPEMEGMYLIGYRPKDWISPVKIDHKLLSMLGVQFGSLPVEYYRTTVGKLVRDVKTVRHEGFVFYTDNGVSAKIKSPYYLTSKWVARNPKTDKLVDTKRDIKLSLDEEYHPLVDKIRENIVEYTAMNEQERLAWVRGQLEF